MVRGPLPAELKQATWHICLLLLVLGEGQACNHSLIKNQTEGVQPSSQSGIQACATASNKCFCCDAPSDLNTFMYAMLRTVSMFPGARISLLSYYAQISCS